MTSIHYAILGNETLFGIHSSGKYPTEQIRTSLIDSPIRPVVLESSANEYRLHDGKTALIKTEVEWIQKTSLFNNGTPIFYVKTKKIDEIK